MKRLREEGQAEAPYSEKNITAKQFKHSEIDFEALGDNSKVLGDWFSFITRFFCFKALWSEGTKLASPRNWHFKCEILK